MAKEENYRMLETLMTKKVLTAKKECTILDAAKLMAKKKCSCLVVEEKNKPVGLITERDMVKRVIAKEKDPKKVAVKDVMTSPIKTVNPDSKLVPAVEFMKKYKIRRVPVVDKNGHLIGIVTETDIMNGISKLVKHLDWKLVSMKISLEDYFGRLKESKII